MPSQKTDLGYAIDLDSQIILKGYKFTKRKDLHKNAKENQLTEMAKQWK